MSDVHPLYRTNGYQISTLPGDEFMKFVMDRISAGDQGTVMEGRGRLGKTCMLRLLVSRSNTWLQSVGVGVAARLRIPSGGIKSSSTFYEMLADTLGLIGATRAADDKKMKRIANWVCSQCGAAGVSQMIVFIDNAQHLTRLNYEYIADITDDCEESGIRLFVVFVRQSDVDGIDLKMTHTDYPSHLSGRFFMASHAYTGLLGLPHIEHALSRYDKMEWPLGSNVTYTQYFARSAYEKRSYRIASQAVLITTVVQNLRAKSGLPAHIDWPMKSFSAMVHFLLTRIAFNDVAFDGFSEQHVLDALNAVGYLTLEYSHASRRTVKAVA